MAAKGESGENKDICEEGGRGRIVDRRNVGSGLTVGQNRYQHRRGFPESFDFTRESKGFQNSGLYFTTNGFYN